MVISGAGVCQLNGSNTFTELWRTPPETFDAELSLGGNQTVSGVLKLVGSSPTGMFIVHSANLGVQVYVDVGAGTATIGNVTFQDVLVKPVTATFTGINIGDGQGNLDGTGHTGVVFSTGSTLRWAGGSGSWSDIQHWIPTNGTRIPLPQDTVVFSDSQASTVQDTITLDMYRLGGTLDFSGLLHPIKLLFAAPREALYGDLKLSSQVTVAFSGGGTKILSLRGRGSQHLTSGGAEITIPVQVRCPGGSYALTDALSGVALVIDAGT